MTEDLGKKILIAEDEAPIAKALELKLNNSGFLAKTVANGDEALEEIKNNQYDLLLTLNKTLCENNNEFKSFLSKINIKD